MIVCNNDDDIYIWYVWYVCASRSFIQVQYSILFFWHSWMLKLEVQLNNGLISSGVTTIPNLKEQKVTFTMIL